MAPPINQPENPLIIVADDQQSTRLLVRNYLERDGYNLLDAGNGKEAYELFLSKNPDLILLDIFMPEMDGLEACSMIKQTPEGRNTPVLIFTASDEGRNMEKAYLSGAADFINKPINAEELRHRVKRLLYLRKLELERQAAEKKLALNYKKQRQLSRKVLNAYEEERLRLARELHDELGMSLSTVKLNLQMTKKKLSKREDDLRENFTDLIDLVDGVLSQVRSKASFIRPPSLDEFGLVTVLDKMISEIGIKTGLNVSFKTDGCLEKLPPEVEIAIYRCIQEALTNIVRHARASSAEVIMSNISQTITATISDNGEGFKEGILPNKIKSSGIKGMQERAALLDGDFEINSNSGEGTTVSVSIPLEDNMTGSV